MLRLAAAVFVGLHGIVHWIGFAVPWGLMASQSNPDPTRGLWGTLALGDGGAHIVGALWLVPLALFVLAAVAIWRRAAWALAATALAAALSLVVCLIGSPAAIVGTVIDVAILAIAAVLVMRGSAGPARFAH